MTDAEIFRKNVLIHKPSKMLMIEMETKAGYNKDHLSHMVKRNWRMRAGLQKESEAEGEG